VLCRVLGVSRSADYSWKQHKPRIADQRNKAVEQQVISIFQQHRRRYGVRRIAAELKATAKIKAGVYIIRKIMKKHGLTAIQPRSFVPKTTDSQHTYAISPNLLLERSLPPRKPDEVWVGDITYIPLSGGTYGYLSVWMDLYSRKIIGWQLEDNMKEQLVIAAFKKALVNRTITAALIIHSDRGGQYGGNGFRKLLNSTEQMKQSMSRRANPYDNAFMESCFSRFKTELLQGGAFDNLQDAHTEIFEYIEMYYNTTRRHSALNYQSPMNYENNYYLYNT